MLGEILRTKIVAAMSPGVSQVFYGYAPPDTAYPYVVFTVSGDEPLQTLTGPHGLSRCDLDVEFYAATALVALTHAGTLRAALDGWTAKTETPSIQACSLRSHTQSFDTPREGDESFDSLVSQVYSIWYR